ncbi:hypothetical protein KGF56_004374 [Candida oxycetoniae]|uniref:Protein TAPT1 homolog n=1 Tax=Candida oxycetoniae TaxID=497107 RepID=A0AAI9SU83_9ASCO|nr:uncharacterized protein KGF56_004374 [Candida oxycetoniae]KAI3402913.2 hypothetical protein KGF56_004374 [Candida oxycetoniae]
MGTRKRTNRSRKQSTTTTSAAAATQAKVSPGSSKAKSRVKTDSGNAVSSCDSSSKGASFLLKFFPFNDKSSSAATACARRSSHSKGKRISFYDLLLLELNLSPISDEDYEEKDGASSSVQRALGDDESYQELINMLSMPWYLEKFMLFGLLVCFNSFLTLYTLVPLKIVAVLIQITIKYFFHNCKTSSIIRRLKSIEKDVISLTLIAMSLAVLCSGVLDISKLYHDVRGQAEIKLYVTFGVLEVAEKLCSSIGQDLLNILYCTSPVDHFWRFLAFYLISIFYLSFHAYILIYQSVALNVAANSYSNALLTLLLSNQFAELKSSVFKKLDREGLFQITMADLSERFQLTLMLGIIAIRNLLQLHSVDGLVPNSWQSWNIWLGAILAPGIIVIGSEVFVDWLKHCFISKFNKIKPKVYRNFLYVSCLDFLQEFQYSTNSGGNNVDKDHKFTDYIITTRRIGLPLLASAVCFLRMTLGDFKQLFIIRGPNGVYCILATVGVVVATIFTLSLIRILLVLGVLKIANQSVTKHRIHQKELKAKLDASTTSDKNKMKQGKPTPSASDAASSAAVAQGMFSPIDMSFLPGSPNTEPSTINPSTRIHLYDADEDIPPTPEEKRNKALRDGVLNETRWNIDEGDEGLSKVMRYKMSSKRIW